MALSSKGQETRLSIGKWSVRFSQASPIWRDGQGQVAGFSVQRRMVVPCSRHQHGSLDQRSRSPPSQGGNARSNRARITIWLLGQGKVARFSGGRRWLACHQQSPLPIAQLQCVKSNMLMQVGHSFGVFQPSGIMLVELTWKISKRHASNASLIRLCYGRVCGRVLCTSNINLQLGSLTWKIPRIFTEHLSTNGEVATRWVYFAGGSAIPASALWPRRRIGQSRHPFKVEFLRVQSPPGSPLIKVDT